MSLLLINWGGKSTHWSITSNNHLVRALLVMLMFWELKSLAWINRSVDSSVLCHSCIIRVMWITTLKLTLILKLLLREKETEQLFRLKDKLIDQLNRHTEQTLIRRQLKHETSYETNPASGIINSDYIFSFISFSFTNKWHKPKHLNSCMYFYFTITLEVMKAHANDMVTQV